MSDRVSIAVERGETIVPVGANGAAESAALGLTQQQDMRD
jgi:hypothetical protein